MIREKVWKTVAVIIVTLLPALVFANKPPDGAQKARIMNKTYRMQIPFIENRGQIENEDVSFYAQTFGGTLFVGKDGVLTYSLPSGDKGVVILKEIVTEAKPKVKGLTPSSTRINYFKGNDKNMWRGRVGG